MFVRVSIDKQDWRNEFLEVLFQLTNAQRGCPARVVPVENSGLCRTDNERPQKRERRDTAVGSSLGLRTQEFSAIGFCRRAPRRNLYKRTRWAGIADCPAAGMCRGYRPHTSLNQGPPV